MPWPMPNLKSYTIVPGFVVDFGFWKDGLDVCNEIALFLNPIIWSWTYFFTRWNIILRKPIEGENEDAVFFKIGYSEDQDDADIFLNQALYASLGQLYLPKNLYFNVNKLINENIPNDTILTALQDNLNNYTKEQQDLLSVSSFLNKYYFRQKYGNKKQIFKTSTPLVEYLDKTCVAGVNTIGEINGNESAEDCLAKKGQIVKRSRQAGKISA